MSIRFPIFRSSLIMSATARASKNSALRTSIAIVTVVCRTGVVLNASISFGSIIGGILSMQKLPRSAR